MSDPDALLHDFQSITDPLSLEELFPLSQPNELEIGCGDGGFLLSMPSAIHAETFWESSACLGGYGS